MDNNYIGNYGNGNANAKEKKMPVGGKGMGVYGLAVGNAKRTGNTNSNSSKNSSLKGILISVIYCFIINYD